MLLYEPYMYANGSNAKPNLRLPWSAWHCGTTTSPASCAPPHRKP